jgi:hypothetical protein
MSQNRKRLNTVSPTKRHKVKSKDILDPLTLDEIALFKQLPLLTLQQIARVLQKPIEQIYEMARARARRPLPVFKSGRTICSTWAKIQAWVDDGFEERRVA